MLNLTAVFALFLQADAAAGAAGPVGPPATPSGSAIVEMVLSSGPVAQAVLGLLALASFYSWTLILGKASSFRRVTATSRKFVRAFRKASRLQEVSALAVEHKASPLAQVFEDVYEAYKRQTGGQGPPRNLNTLERAAQTACSEAVTQLESRLTWLATIAAVSPFVGLFGTVMGIVDAFHGLGTAGSATLHAVAPGISEALITTAAGLFVAVPAVVAYNLFTARIRVLAAAIDDFARELLNSLEEIPVRVAAPPTRPLPSVPPEHAAGGERGLYK